MSCLSNEHSFGVEDCSWYGAEVGGDGRLLCLAFATHSRLFAEESSSLLDGLLLLAAAILLRFWFGKF